MWKEAIIFLVQKRIHHQQLNIFVNFPQNILFEKLSNRYISLFNAKPQTMKQNWLISNHQKIWRKIIYHFNADVFTQLKLSINYLRGKHMYMYLPALQNQHGTCFRTEEEKQIVFNFMHASSKWFFGVRQNAVKHSWKEPHTTQFHGLKTLTQGFFKIPSM